MRCINTLISLKSNMDLDLSKSLICLWRTLFTFLTFPISARRKFTASRPPLSLLYIRTPLSHSHKTDPLAERLPPLLRPFSPKLMWQKESLMVVWRIQPQKESVGWFWGWRERPDKRKCGVSTTGRLHSQPVALKPKCSSSSFIKENPRLFDLTLWPGIGPI